MSCDDRDACSSFGSTAAANLYQNPNGKEKSVKSGYYREPLAVFLGYTLTVEAPSYEIHEDNAVYTQICLQNVAVMESDKSFSLMPGMRIFDHMWMRIRKEMKIVDPRKPLRITGFVNEYEHPVKGILIRNIGITPIYVSQNSWRSLQGLTVGAVPIYLPIGYLFVFLSQSDL